MDKKLFSLPIGQTTETNKGAASQFQIEPTIFEKWYVDHLALPEVDGFKYVLLAVDSFSLYSIDACTYDKRRGNNQVIVR